MVHRASRNKHPDHSGFGKNSVLSTSVGMGHVIGHNYRIFLTQLDQVRRAIYGVDVHSVGGGVMRTFN